MASSSFRDGINRLGWSRRPEAPKQQQPLLDRLQGWNPFGGNDYLRLPTHEDEAPGAPLPAPTRREEEEGWFVLSRWDRLLIFGGLLTAAVALFTISLTLLPVLSLRPRKFAILSVIPPLLAPPPLSSLPLSPQIALTCSSWSMASAFFLISWAVIMGPLPYVRHLFSQERVPFTATYFGSIALTLYCAVGIRSTLLTLPCALVQLVALIWYLVSYFPMGSQGFRLAARFGGSRMTAWLT
ncbi:SFT2-domain-containing protein [Piedraia hortae CBS 480.64]|uniref:Protein transport protein SFT2 n=1 Tax=Piedraia hortae CBS 480.64 TaxID=1314780 RepID=A0A6A7BTD7_9PEZI|nr:SFT2-domain-containing protein [Piedraia hortae CBS 480.64]